MKTGIIVLGRNSDSSAERSVAEESRRFLGIRDRKDVRIAFHQGSPSSDSVMDDMNSEGTDTFVILPLAICEGRETTWDMPMKLGIRDNCGTWRMMRGKDIAIRFATALGRNHAVADELVSTEGEVSDDTLVVVAADGSEFQSRETAQFYADRFRDAGWRAVTYMCGVGEGTEGISDAMEAKHLSRTVVVPLFIAFEGEPAKELAHGLTERSIPFKVSEPVSHLQSFYKVLDSKVPDGW